MLNLMKLENRIVLDGAAVAGIADHASDHETPGCEHETGVTEQHAAAIIDTDHTEAVADAAALLSEENDTNDVTEPLEIIVIDDSLPDYQSLADAAKPGAQVIVYDADTETAADVIDRITQISQELQQPVISLSILSHGGTGSFQLGNEVITAENLNQNAAAWESLDAVLADESQIYLFGCNVSADGSGDALLNHLSEATGADVFASDDTTGNGGDWDLEASSENADAGEFTPPLDMESLVGYSETLAGYSNSVTMDEDTVYTFKTTDFGTNYTKIKITDLESAGDLKLGNQDVTLNQEIDISQIANLQFIPNKDANNNGYSSFKFKVHDGTEYGDSYTMTVNVNPIQDAPTSVDNSVMIYEDTEYQFKTNDFIFNDVDNEDTFVRLQITQAPTSGTLKLNGSTIGLNSVIEYSQLANLVYVPASDFNGEANFQFKVNDGKEYSVNSNTFSIRINSVNDLPTSTDNTVSIAEDTSYTFKSEDFNFNDVDTGDNLAKVQITQLVTAGTLKLDGVKIDDPGTEISLAAIQAGKLTFTPDKDANGVGYSDFRFKVSDGQGYSSDSSTMTINVTEVNDLPTAADNTVRTEENQSYTFEKEDFKFEDVDGDSLTKIQITESVSDGTLQLNGIDIGANAEITIADIESGNLTFVPDDNDSGVPYASFQFKVNDGTEYSTGSYTMSVNVSSVNYLPTASDSTVTTNEDTTYTFKPNDFNFEDTDGDSLVKIQIVQLETAGTLQLNGVDITTLDREISVADIQAGNLTFTPETDANGDGYANFRFKVHDGTGYSEASYTMTVNVTPENDAPTSSDKTVSIEENKAYIFNTNDFKFDDVDVDDDTLVSVQITQLPTDGTLKLNGTEVSEDTEITLADIQAGNLIFQPDVNTSGTAYADFQFKVSDGKIYSTSAYTMTIDVADINDLPTASDNTITLDEDTVYTFTINDFNFQDVDGDSLVEIQITQLETAGSLKLNGTDISLPGTKISVQDIQDGNLTFTPALDANGENYSNFRFKVSDGTGYSTDAYTMTMDVTAVNDPPTSSDNIVTTNQNSGEQEVSYTFELSDFAFNDVDTGDQLEKIQITIPSDMKGELKLNGSVIDSTTLEISAADIEAGKLTFTPEKDESGDGYAKFQFKVDDGTAFSADSYTMTINVTEGNIPPKAVNSEITILEDVTDEESVPGYVFQVSDFGFEDPDGDGISAIRITQLETAGTLKLNGNDVGLNAVISIEDIENGNLRFVPNADANGDGYSNFKFKVQDTGGEYSETSAVMTINVTPVQDEPSTVDNYISMMGVTEDETGYAFKVEDFIFNDVDANDSLQSITITGLESIGTLTWNGKDVSIGDVIPVADIISGKLVFTPVQDQYGQNYDNFQFTVSDGKDNSVEPATLTINVIERPISPEGPANPVEMDEDTTHTFSLADFEFAPNADVDISDTLKIQITKTPTSGILQLNGEDVRKFQEISISDIVSGNLTFTPNQDTNEEKSGEESPFEFKFRVFDSETQKYSVNEYTMAVEVTPVNDQPFSEDEKYTMQKGEDIYVFSTSDFYFENDVDEDAMPYESDQLSSVRITSLPEKGSLRLLNEGESIEDTNGDGKITADDIINDTNNDGKIDIDDVINISTEINSNDEIDVDAIEAGRLIFASESGDYGVKEDEYEFTNFNFKVIDEANSKDSVTGEENGVSDEHLYTIYKLGNEPPEIDLDPDNLVNGKPGVGPDYKAVFMEGNDPVRITDIDAQITDEESDPIQWLTATITADTFKSGDVLAADTSGTDIKASYDAAEGILTLSGEDSLENYSKVLRSITFTCGKENENPTDNERVIEFKANDGSNDSNTVQTTVTVVAVNDAPENYVPGPHSMEVNETLTFSEANGNKLSISDIDAYEYDDNGNAIAREVEVTIHVDHSKLTVKAFSGIPSGPGSSGVEINGNDTDTVVLKGTVDDINAILAQGITYTPETDWSGDATLTITTNDQGAYGSDHINTETGNYFIDPDTGNYVNAARSVTSTVQIEVIGPHPHHKEEPTPIRPVVDISITRPDIGEQEAVELYQLDFPELIMTGDLYHPRGIRGEYPSCKEVELYPCCTLEEALRIGCRLAPAIDPDSRICIEWHRYMKEELGWEDPFVPRIDGEYFNEELDLFNQLFMDGPEGESFNDFKANVLADAFGMADEQAWAAQNRDEEHDVYSQLSMQEDTFNAYNPDELKEGFFEGRSELIDDRIPPGRWRDGNGSLEDC